MSQSGLSGILLQLSVFTIEQKSQKFLTCPILYDQMVEIPSAAACVLHSLANVSMLTGLTKIVNIVNISTKHDCVQNVTMSKAWRYPNCDIMTGYYLLTVTYSLIQIPWLAILNPKYRQTDCLYVTAQYAVCRSINLK